MEAITSEMILSNANDTEDFKIIKKQVVAKFFKNSLGSEDVAITYLEDIINLIDPLYLRKKRAINDMIEDKSHNVYVLGEPQSKSAKTSGALDTVGDIPAVEHFDFDVLNVLYEKDSTDDVVITFAMQVSNDRGMISNMIGTKGSTIEDIRLKTGVKTMLENVSKEQIPPQKDRTVFFAGKLKATLAAYQLMFKKMLERREMTSATNNAYNAPKDLNNEPLIMVVPNDVCAKLIGKGGIQIKNLQLKCGARTTVETEEIMKVTPHSFGRRITITGTFLQRLHAAYLILRFLGTENIYKDLSSQWKGDRVHPLAMPTQPSMPNMQPFSMYGSFPPQPIPAGQPQTTSTMQLPAVGGGQVIGGGPSHQMYTQQQQPSGMQGHSIQQSSIAPGGSLLTASGANAGMAAILNNYQTQQQQPPPQQMFSQQQVLQMLQQQQQQPPKTTYR